MAKSNVIEAARPANAAETMDITRDFMQAGHNFIAVSRAFVAAQDELKIVLKWDRATNRGWITVEEDAAIRAFMTAAL